MKKIKQVTGQFGSVEAALRHNSRDKITPNVDQNRTKNNWNSSDYKDAISIYNSLLPATRRKNAVLAYEVLISAGSDFNGDWNRYFQDSLKWASDFFGGEMNCVHWAIHRDEGTPHLHAVFIPLKGGKLNAKAYTGGKRDRMREIQNEFHEACGRPHGLERGQPREETRAKHTAHNLSNLKSRESAVLAAAADVRAAAEALPLGSKVLAAFQSGLRSVNANKAEVNEAHQWLVDDAAALAVDHVTAARAAKVGITHNDSITPRKTGPKI